MAAVAPFVPAIVGLMAAAAKLTAWQQIILYVAATLIAEEIIEETQDIPDAPKGRDLQVNTSSSKASLPLIYGKVELGGNDVFIHTLGDLNNTLWIVQTLAEGECEGIDQDGESHDLVYVDDKLAYTFGSSVSYWFHSGASDQVVDANLHAAYPDWTDPMENTCYIVWKFIYDPEKFSSVPKRTLVLKGRKIWLPNGTKVYSQNAAADLYDYLRTPHCSLGLAWPGYDTIESKELDYWSYQSAYTYCDTKGWNFNGAILGRENARNAINRIRKHFRGSLRWSDGMFYFKYRDLNYESSVMNLTDDHLLRDPTGKAMISISQPGLLGLMEALKVSFVDPSKRYSEDSIFVGESEGIIKHVALSGYLDREKAGAMGSYLLERSKNPYNRTINGTFRDDATQLEVDDVICLWCTALDYNGQYMRVVSVKLLPSGFVQLGLILEHLDLYNDTYDAEIEGTYESDLPNPNYFDPVTSPERMITLTGDKVLAVEDLNKVYAVVSDVDVTITTPSVDLSHIGSWLRVINKGIKKVTIQMADSDKIDNSAAGGKIWNEKWS